jgi:hypothetical protein
MTSRARHAHANLKLAPAARGNFSAPMIATLPHTPSLPPAPAAHVSAKSAAPALKILPQFGELGVLNTGSALKAAGIKLTNRIVLRCQTLSPVARPACGLGAPGITATGGSLAPDLSSGTATAKFDIKFVRGSRSVAISSGRLVAAGGKLTVEARIGSHVVSIGTIHSKVTRTISGITIANGSLLLTAPGARAIGHALGAHLKSGGVISSRFGGNVDFIQANIASGSAAFTLPGSLGTITSVAPAHGAGNVPSLPVLAAVIPVTRDSFLNGTLHLAGGFSFTSHGKSVTLSHVSISLHGAVIDNRTDVLHARVNGTEVELATAVQSTPDDQDTGSGPSESDLEKPVTLTAAGAKALGRGFRAGESLGSIALTASVAH